MKHKKEKLIKIMNELVSFCVDINIKDLKIDFKCHEDRGEVTIEGYGQGLDLDKIENLERIFNSPRQKELEEYYWNLVGEGHSELEMVGTLVDSGSISYENNNLKISIYRDQRT